MKNLQSFGVQELNTREIRETQGGLLFLAAIPLAKAFAWGVAAGIAIGTVVLTKLLEEK